MKFFTAILSALTLALAVLITSATPIDPRRRTSFPLNIMKRQTINVVPGNTVAMLWDPSSFPSGKTGFLKLVIGDLSDPGELFSLPPPPGPRAHRLEFVFPPVAELGKLNLCATSPFSFQYHARSEPSNGARHRICRRTVGAFRKQLCRLW